MTQDFEIIWLTEERCFAELISLGAYVSAVHYTREGIDYETIIMNDEFEYIEREEFDFDNDGTEGTHGP